ncbi:MAG: tRNA uridine-5-carboxymethylaminomethyl(34) synthesis enzyme MnmG, partial [Oscillospiraceae bacterium]
LQKYAAVEQETRRLESTHVAPTEQLCALLLARETSATATGASLADLLRRPQISYADLAPFDENRPELPRIITEQVEISLKYAGYIVRQLKQVEEFSKMENRKLPREINYEAIDGIRLEARQKLQKIRPENFGQASRISGVSPSDMAALMIYTESGKARGAEK